jgi:hypothetical protein
MTPKANPSKQEVLVTQTGRKLDPTEEALLRLGWPLNLKNYLGAAGLEENNLTPEDVAGFPPQIQREWEKKNGVDNPQY